jgi:hypothetical protein
MVLGIIVTHTLQSQASSICVLEIDRDKKTVTHLLQNRASLVRQVQDDAREVATHNLKSHMQHSEDWNGC